MLTIKLVLKTIYACKKSQNAAITELFSWSETVEWYKRCERGIEQAAMDNQELYTLLLYKTISSISWLTNQNQIVQRPL